MFPKEEEIIKSGSGRGSSSGRGSKICTHCVFTNHTVDECYEKHGYPPGHKLYKPQGSNINNINAVKEESDGIVLERNQEAQSDEVELTSQQYKALMIVLQQQNSIHNNSHVNQISGSNGSSNIHKGSVLSITCNVSKSSPNEWIIDSGATDHVSAFSHLFSFYKKIDPISVKLPTGHSHCNSCKQSSILSIPIS